MKKNKTSKSCRVIVESVKSISGSPINDLIVFMLSVRNEPEEAKLNITTISDGKGGRIFL